ncbi:helix-hairpin-helix domain-containing protein [Salinisphaera sp. USBA-960]|uniref:ComEA family DNA-binding protein n=1 Tax=Salinisphaera orenii TaxID=856731 RepID=UPI000DBE2C13|nr:helix-hairpin-helix domain-containing protein [Salifodinibacter halophilus]NNC25607.1 helix-hairpin-helix domain-containing protein [Salifodinibacter halophilus]
MKKITLAVAVVGALLFAGASSAEVNVNTAQQDQLTELKGIGPATAQKIIKDRKANGDYERLDDLTRVNGIGSKTVDDIRDDATVDDDDNESDAD